MLLTEERLSSWWDSHVTHAIFVTMISIKGYGIFTNQPQFNMDFRLFFIFLFHEITLETLCSTNVDYGKISTSMPYKQGLFKTTQSILEGNQLNDAYRDAKIDWIRNVTLIASFVSVTTYDRDVIISEFEYNGIDSLRVARITPENDVVWNSTYVLSPLDTNVVVHESLELVWFAQYSKDQNCSYLIGLNAQNGTVRHNFTIANYIKFQVDLESAHICAVSYDYYWNSPNFTLLCYDASLPTNQLLWTTSLIMNNSTGSPTTFVSYPSIDFKIKRVYVSTMPKVMDRIP